MEPPGPLYLYEIYRKTLIAERLLTYNCTSFYLCIDIIYHQILFKFSVWLSWVMPLENRKVRNNNDYQILIFFFASTHIFLLQHMYYWSLHRSQVWFSLLIVNYFVQELYPCKNQIRKKWWDPDNNFRFPQHASFHIFSLA